MAFKQRLKLLLAAGAILFLAIVAGIGVFWYSAFGPGWTMHDTARILVHDDKFGARAQSRAISYGDSILPVLATESDDFRGLNWRNAFWIADVLGANRSNLSRSMAANLYSRPGHLPHLVGAVALAEQGDFEERDANELLASIPQMHDESEVELAVLALGKAHAGVAIPMLLTMLDEDGMDYWRAAYACDAVARIGDKRAIPRLQSCLRRPRFYALPNAFRALVALGDRNAVPLAIARVSPDIREYNSGFVVKELETVTGKRFGFSQTAWAKWWESVEQTWQIPPKFLEPFDLQPLVY